MSVYQKGCTIDIVCDVTSKEVSAILKAIPKIISNEICQQWPHTIYNNHGCMKYVFSEIEYNVYILTFLTFL